MSRKIWILVLVLAVSGGAWWYWQRSHAAEATSAHAGPGGAGSHGSHGGRGGGFDSPVPVIAGAVEKRDVPIFLDGLGTVQAFNTVTVKVRVDGQLDKVAFTEGQNVRAGDLLAEIDPRPYKSVYDQAVARKAQDEALLANGKLILQRNQDLLAKKVLDQQTFDTQKYAVDQLNATIQGDQAAIDNAKTQLDYTRVTAPIDGRVGVRQVDQGNIVRAADTTGLVVITQLQPISVVFTLPEQNFQTIHDTTVEREDKSALEVTAVDRDNAKQIGKGALAVIDNQIDTTTGTIKLKATFPNEDLRMWPGQFINARLLLTTRKDGLVVPASVVQRGPQGSFAFVIKPDQTVESRPVKVAQIEDNLALIDDGLQAGEQVVIDGQYKLQEGSRVQVGSPGGKESGDHGQPRGSRLGTNGGKPPAGGNDDKAKGLRQHRSGSSAAVEQTKPTA